MVSLNRAVLSDQVKEILLKRILDGEYSPGDRLVEMHIAQEFEISQAPVREALRELEALGFVESEPYRGTRVRAVTKSELTEIYPVRAALEEVAARAAAVHLAGNVEALEAELEAMLAAAEKGDLYEEVQHDVEFHRLIVEASGNRVLQDMWRSLRIEARTLISVLKAHIGGYELAEMHRPVLEALAEGDAEKAGLLLRNHVEYFGELIMKGDSA
ncbi:MAG: GntR family transcriptional regulator [Chloroflexi bacterium]|nr:MAG: GntR family transcriptional regulator [Chloroflexota bacterium]TMD76084.1 MAG: GntR family transcriptional regulator [Chloroflexota bacterium]